MGHIVPKKGIGVKKEGIYESGVFFVDPASPLDADSDVDTIAQNLPKLY